VSEAAFRTGLPIGIESSSMSAKIAAFSRAILLSALLFQAGCGGSSPPTTAPEFLIVVNQSATGTGLAEYALPLSSGQSPVVTLPSQGTYLGGFTDGSYVFAFGEGTGSAPTVWRYGLPLSTSPTPAVLTGLGGIPYGATGLASGSVVVFLEKNPSNGMACLEGYNLSNLLGTSTGGNVTPLAGESCSAIPISKPSNATSFLTGSVQLSSDGSDLYVETVYQTSGGTPTTVIQTYSPSLFSLIAYMTTNVSYPSTLQVLEGAPEPGNVVLLLPHPTSPGVDFYQVSLLTSNASSGTTVSPLYSSTISLASTPSVLALDVTGTYLLTAQAGTGDTIASFGLNDVQNGSNAAPLAQAGAGLSLNPVGLVVIVSSSG
jgi:hypothetical protein